MTAPPRSNAQLSRILGVGFGLALAFGNTVGVGILRLPGEVAAALGDASFIATAWIIGGIYATLGAFSVSELAAMLPTAGGFYVYARRAFGTGVGFVIGWSDWIANTASTAYGSLTAAEYLAALVPSLAGHGTLLAVGVLVLFTGLHWLGLRVGGGIQLAVSATVGVVLVTLAIACFTVPTPASTLTLPASAAHMPLMSLGWLVMVAAAMRSIIITYDGWYGAIYLAEETTDAARNVPRAIIMCTTIATGLYVLINLGFLHVLSLPVLAASHLAAADAASALLPSGSAQFVTAVSLLTVLSLVNALLLVTPRILYAFGRDGLFAGQATQVSAGGTPRVALGVTAAAAAFLIVTGTFEQTVAIAAVLYVLNYLSAYIAVFKLRRSEPNLPRPYRAWGYPYTTGLVLVGSVTYLVTVVIADIKSTLFAVLLLGVSGPVYWWIKRSHAMGRSAEGRGSP